MLVYCDMEYYIVVLLNGTERRASFETNPIDTLILMCYPFYSTGTVLEMF